MAKNDWIENVLVAVFGGVMAVLLNLYNGYTAGLLWGFITGVFITSIALVLGKLAAHKLR